jgi:transcriptional regulator with XRE-family HTH domain
MTKKQKQRILEQVRTAIEESPLSRYELSKRSGVGEASLSRFMRGGSLAIDTIEKLAPVLELELVLKSRQ